MKKFICSVLDPNKGRISLLLEAIDYNTLKQSLKEKNIILLTSQEYSSKKYNFPTIFNNKNAISQLTIAHFSYDLATMLQSGISISTALEILKNTINNKLFSSIILSILNTIKEGKSFTQAILPFTRIFNYFYINMVTIGEESGNLSTVLFKLSSSLKDNFYLKQKIFSIFLYPCITFFFALALGVFLIIFILPEFIKIFQESGQKLPFLTEFLLFFYNLLVNYYFHLTFFVIILSFFSYKFFKSNKGIFFKYKFFTFFPLIRNIYRKYLYLQILSSFYFLLSSGVSLFNSFKLIIPLIENPFLKKELELSLLNLKKGESLNKTLKNSIFFNDTTLLMISIGENSGTLSEMFNNAYEFTLNEFNFILKRLVTLIEPFLILFLGLFIGIIVLGLYLPIFNLISII